MIHAFYIRQRHKVRTGGTHPSILPKKRGKRKTGLNPFHYEQL